MSNILIKFLISDYMLSQPLVILILLFTVSLLVVYASCQRNYAIDDSKIKYDQRDDPCAPYDPPVPNFRRPGRRISLTKCYEYIWEIKLRIDRAKRSSECREKIHLESKGTKREIKEKLLNDNFNDTTAFERPHTTYILGGHDAKPAEFPHMGAVGWQSVDEARVWKWMCGCTLISPKFALSAAHCSRADSRDTTVADINPKIVRFGVEDILGRHIKWDRLPVDRLITKVIVHPQYASPKKYFDLALFELDYEISFTGFVQPACLWNGGVDNLKDTTIAGWGDTAEGAYKGSPVLKVAEIGIVNFNTCDSLLKPYCNRLWCGLQDHQFCAGQLSGGVDTCQGDSGGPFQMKIPLPAETKESMHYVIGVTSFGFGCGRANVPGVYTKVLHFLNWIESVVWN